MKKYWFYSILLCLTWTGMLLGISFLEAPVKFTAPSLTLPVGLDVGRHVFQAFNKVEMVFAGILLMIMFTLKSPVRLNIIFSAVISLLLLQCFWLLPILDERALQIIAGQTPTTLSPHAWYIVFDALKAFLLLVAPIFCFREIKVVILSTAI
jgi:hypothetical protein